MLAIASCIHFTYHSQLLECHPKQVSELVYSISLCTFHACKAIEWKREFSVLVLLYRVKCIIYCCGSGCALNASFTGWSTFYILSMCELHSWGQNGLYPDVEMLNLLFQSLVDDRLLLLVAVLEY